MKKINLFSKKNIYEKERNFQNWEIFFGIYSSFAEIFSEVISVFIACMETQNIFWLDFTFLWQNFHVLFLLLSASLVHSYAFVKYLATWLSYFPLVFCRLVIPCHIFWRSYSPAPLPSIPISLIHLLLPPPPSPYLQRNSPRHILFALIRSFALMLQGRDIVRVTLPLSLSLSLLSCHWNILFSKMYEKNGLCNSVLWRFFPFLYLTSFCKWNRWTFLLFYKHCRVLIWIINEC